MTTTPSTPKFDVGGVLLDRPFKAGRLGHVGLYQKNMDKAIVFYRDLLGFRITDQISPEPPEAMKKKPPPGAGGPPGGPEGMPMPDLKGQRLTFFSYGTDHHAMVLVPAILGQMMDKNYLRGVTLNQMSFQVGTLDEMVNAHTLLQQKGADIWRVCRDVPGSNWAVYFRDPDGHTCELYYGMEQIGWEGRSKPMPAFHEFAYEEAPELPRIAEREEISVIEAKGVPLASGFRSVDPMPAKYPVGGIILPRPFKITRTGPMSLFVNDIDASVRFYTAEMGLTVSEEVSWQGHRMVFLRASNEHHSVAVAPIAMRKELGLSEHTTVMAYGMQVGSYRQLKDAVAFLEENGCEQIHLPSALFPGIDYAAHFLDPDGHCIQLYYYMEQIGWDGQPRPAGLRRQAVTPWPDTLEALPDTYADRTFQGPLG